MLITIHSVDWFKVVANCSYIQFLFLGWVWHILSLKKSLSSEDLKVTEIGSANGIPMCFCLSSKHGQNSIVTSCSWNPSRNGVHSRFASLAKVKTADVGGCWTFAGPKGGIDRLKTCGCNMIEPTFHPQHPD